MTHITLIVHKITYFQLETEILSEEIQKIGLA